MNDKKKRYHLHAFKGIISEAKIRQLEIHIIYTLMSFNV